MQSRKGCTWCFSREGSKIFAREDINRRAYKFATGRDFSTDDILSGRVSAPREAEDLYASLHSVEFAHEMLNIPTPPYLLLDDLENDWIYNTSTLAKGKDSTKQVYWFSMLSTTEAQEFSAFETTFKSFVYGGVSVQRISPRHDDGAGAESLKRRTLWLMLPEVVLFVSSILSSSLSYKLMGFFITTSLFPFVVLTFFGVPMSKESSSDASLSASKRSDRRFLELVDSAIEADYEPSNEEYYSYWI
mmetsp:Transcript_3967/g.6043  ORF Transcript_3967/g.6043 Transcript_3967/m.6043 type:complete len:246 (+) Transcript_3967:1327-2064(+)